jgi:hypothetical protein
MRALHHIDGDPDNNDPANLRVVNIEGRVTMKGVAKMAAIGSPQAILVREAHRLVAAIDALLDERRDLAEENQMRWSHGDR